MEKLEQFIGSYKDFPKKGIIFRDTLEILKEPVVFNELIKNMSTAEFFNSAEAILCIDARGFIFGSAISLLTSKPLVVARKPGKLPGELVTKSYKLEYGKNVLSIQKKSVEKFESFVIVDDLLATGGTANCVYEMLKNFGKRVTGLSVVVELKKLKGRSKIPISINSQIVY